MPGPLDGRTALVTGAAAGTGRAISERIVADGAFVVAGDIDPVGLDPLTVELGDHAGVAMLSRVAAMELGRRGDPREHRRAGLVETTASAAF